MPWNEQEDARLTERFGNGSKIIELVTPFPYLQMNKSQANQTCISTEITKPSKLLNCQALLCELYFGLSETLRPDLAYKTPGFAM